MLVHMSPDEVMNLQRMARMRGDTMTINPETGLPEAFKLRKLLRGLAAIAPIAAAFFPPLAAALPALATPLGAGAAGAIAGGLSGEKGFDLKRGLTGGLLSYGLSSAMQGLQAAGGASAGAAPSGEFTAAELAKMSPQAQAAVAGAPVGYGSLATPGAESMLAAQEAGVAGLRGVSGAPISSAAPMGTASEGLSKLFSSDPAMRAAAQEAFTGQFGKGAMYATGIGALGTAALDEQEKYAKQALEQERISKEEYDKAMESIAQARRRAQYAVRSSPLNLQQGGAINTKNTPIRPYPVKFFDGGGGDDGDSGNNSSDSSGNTDSGTAGSSDGDASTVSDTAAAAADVGGPAFGGNYGGSFGEDFGMPSFNDSIDASMGQAMADSMAAANAGMAGPAASLGGDGGVDNMYITNPALLDASPFSKPTKKKWEDMTPEEQEIERRKYILTKYRMGFAAGGNVGRAGLGSLPPRYIDGRGDGMSDSVPAVISNKQPARLADGEFVIPADVVSHLGNGSSKAGAQQLYAMMDRVRRARTGNPKQGRQIKPAQQMPA
jgi:hypothetical protein